nr:uncharacterized protein LOC127342342 [Lolium perenne]
MKKLKLVTRHFPFSPQLPRPHFLALLAAPARSQLFPPPRILRARHRSDSSALQPLHLPRLHRATSVQAMAAGTSPGGTFLQGLEGALSADGFFPVPELVGSLIPPPDASESFDRPGSERSIGGGGTEAGQRLPQEGCSVNDEGGAQGVGGGFDGHADEELGSGIYGCVAQETH